MGKERQEQIRYLFFGVLTTIVNYGSFWALTLLWGDDQALLVNIPVFLISSAFAYVTNKLFVFYSRSWEPKFVLREAGIFLGARIVSFFFEEIGLYVCVNLLHFNQYTIGSVSGAMLSKIGLSVLAVFINYVLSKFLIFRKGKEGVWHDARPDDSSCFQ